MYGEHIRVSNEALQALPKVKMGDCKLYTCEFPVKSPEFKSPKEVIRWFCELGEKDKLAIKKLNGFIISELSVALNDRLVGNEVYHRGEIFREEDWGKFDFQSGKWVGCRN